MDTLELARFILGPFVSLRVLAAGQYSIAQFTDPELQQSAPFLKSVILHCVECALFCLPLPLSRGEHAGPQ